MDVDLDQRRVAYHEERVAERLEVVAQRLRIEALPLDEEDRAVPVARSLVVDSLLGELVELDRKLRQRLAGETVVEATEDLDEPGASRVDHTALSQDGQLLRGACDRGFAGGDHPCQRLVDRAGRGSPVAPPPRPSHG